MMRDHEPPYKGQPMVVSEYGGTWWNPAEADAQAWGYGRRPASEQEFIERFIGLAEALLRQPAHRRALLHAAHRRRAGGQRVYTYDRKPKFPPDTVRAVISKKAAIESL